MPYIKRERQVEIDPHLKAFANQIGGIKDSGELNYIITQLCIGVTESGYTYEDLNRVMGVLECAKAEFYRRVIVPYEEGKKEDNGDVYPEPEQSPVNIASPPPPPPPNREVAEGRGPTSLKRPNS